MHRTHFFFSIKVECSDEDRKYKEKEESVKQTHTHKKSHKRWFRFERRNLCRTIVLYEKFFTVYMFRWKHIQYMQQMRTRYDHVAARSLNEFGGGKVV